jgi:hypothetical protein
VADSPAFEFVCGEIERLTQLSRLEARGTVRLALKEAGLGTAARPREIKVVIEKVLPRELGTRGVASAEQVCSEIAAGVSRLSDDGGAQTPDVIFSRLAGGS